MRERLLKVAELYRDEGRHTQAEFLEHIAEKTREIDFTQFWLPSALQMLGVHRHNCACEGPGSTREDS